MGGFRVTKIGDWLRAKRTMARLASADLRPPLKGAGEHMLTRVSDAFEEEKSPSGEKWKPSKKRSGKTLTDTARLKKSVAYEVVGDDVHVGTNVVYGAIHNYGGETGRAGARFEMPQRTFLAVTDEDREEFGEMFREFVEDLVE